MTTGEIYLGLDPASRFFGCCWVGSDGRALESLAILTPYTVIRGTKMGKNNRNHRLDQIEEELRLYIADFLTHFREHTFAAICIEQPDDRFGTNRHDISFVNGMSYRMAYTVVRDLGVQVYEVTPAESSSYLGLSRNAKKEDRCSQSALMNGGHFIWPDMDNPDPKKRSRQVGAGTAIGGRMAGASADALDAYSAAHAGFHLLRENRLKQLAEHRKDRSCPSTTHTGVSTEAVVKRKNS